MDFNKNTVVDYQGVADRTDGSEAPSKRTRTARSYVLLAALTVLIALAIVALALYVQSGAGATP
jgi:hypothetical protein